MIASLVAILGLIHDGDEALTSIGAEQVAVAPGLSTVASSSGSVGDQLYRSARVELCKEEKGLLAEGSRARELMREAAAAGNPRARAAVVELDMLRVYMGQACLEGSWPNCAPPSETRRQVEAKLNDEWTRITRELDQLVDEKEPCAVAQKARLVLQERNSSPEELRTARKMMTDAAASGCTIAHDFLGSAYASGTDGFPINHDQAQYWRNRKKAVEDTERVLYCGADANDADRRE